MTRSIERFHRILIVDDNAEHRRQYVDAILRREPGGTPRPPMVAVAENGVEAWQLVQQAIAGGFPFETVATDLEMPHMSGLELIGRLSQLARDNRPRVVAVSTSESDRDSREQQLQRLQSEWREDGGQFEYSFRGATRGQDGQDALLAKIWLHAWGGVRSDDKKYQFVTGGADDPLEKQLTKLRRFAERPGSGLVIVGESGTGKEMAAKEFHAHSIGTGKRFIPFNALAVPSELAESQLFGHVKGAFTGAHATHEGYFEAAQGGSVFIDEMQGLALETQGKLLRVLQEKQVTKVGSNVGVKVDFRLIAAFSSDPKILVGDGRFRKDLYYRLFMNAGRVDLPPLRDRKGAILPLADYYWAEARREMGFTDCSSPWSEECRALLLGARWAGNVRELVGVVNNLSREDPRGDGFAKHLRDAMAMIEVPDPSAPQNFAAKGRAATIHDAIHAAMKRGVNEGLTSIESALAPLSSIGLDAKQARSALEYRRNTGCSECKRLSALLRPPNISPSSR